MNPSAGDFPIVPNQFMPSFNQGAQSAQGMMQGGIDLAKLPQQLKYLQIQNALNEYKRQQASAEAPYYGKMALANLQQAQALPQETLSRAGLSRAQTNEINQLLPYETQSKKLDVQKAIIANNLMKQILGQGNNNNNSTSNIPNTTVSNQSPSIIGASNVLPQSSFNNISSIQNKNNSLPSPNMNASPNNLSYAQSAIASQLLGLPKPQLQQIPGTGQISAITPFGNIPVAQGLTAKEEAEQKGLGKYYAQSYGNYSDAAKGFQNQNVALDNLIALKNNPDFYNVTGPVQSFLTQWAGTPEKQQLLGQLQSSSGEIALQVAPILKGAFTGRDQNLINNIKANPTTDFPEVFIGKLMAQKLVNNVLEKRSELAAQYIENGMSPLKASKLATEQTPIDQFKEQVNKLVNPMVKLKNKVTGKVIFVSADKAKKMMENE
jgi:hypothetical protein